MEEEEVHSSFLVKNFQGDTKYTLNYINSIYLSNWPLIQTTAKFTTSSRGAFRKRAWNAGASNPIVRPNTANVSVVARLVGTSVVAGSVATRKCGKMPSPTWTRAANAGNQDAPKSIASAFRTARSVVRSANALTAATGSELELKLSESASRPFSISPHL